MIAMMIKSLVCSEYNATNVYISEGWLGCQMCLRLFHRGYTDIYLSDMTEEDV